MARILVIDDSPIILTLVACLLTKKGHTVTATGNSQRGMELVAKGSYDLVVTDILMPKRDGFEIIRAIRNARSDIPVIAMSGHVGTLDYLRFAVEMGANGAIRKPIQPDALLREVGILLPMAA
jgi:CheY-like chemotaxis protein